MTSRRRPPAASEEGLTLVELLTVIALTAVLAGAATSMVLTSTRVQRGAVETTVAMDSARVAIDRLQRELRGARRIDQCTQRLLQVWPDTNGNGTTETSEQVFYELTTTGDRLERWTAAAPARVVVARNVLSTAVPAFTCDTTARTIALSFSVDSKSTQPPPPIPIAVTVRLRNG